MQNYDKEMHKQIETEGCTPEKTSLLLHSCCGPCSSYVLKYLQNWFRLTVFYYNPNIYPREEYEKRKAEQIRLIEAMNEQGADIRFLEGDYDEAAFYAAAKGLEQEKECGARCHKCYALRLHKTAETALLGKYDYFTTTLTVSPHKDAEILNILGKEAEALYGVRYLPSDFKKRDGYLQSIRLSKAYGLYRQNYCGCVFSMGHLQKNEQETP